MNKKIFFTDGPDKRAIEGLGVFEKGVPKEVDSYVAENLIARRIFKYWVEDPIVESPFVNRGAVKRREELNKVDNYNNIEEV